MSEYTPTTNEARGLATSLWEGAPLTVQEFDRWLASVKAEAWAEGYSSGQDSVYTAVDEWPAVTANPYRDEPK